MYEANKTEKEILTKSPFNYDLEGIDILDAESEKVRKGIPIDFLIAVAVCNYQSALQSIRERKKWWRFWK